MIAAACCVHVYVHVPYEMAQGDGAWINVTTLAMAGVNLKLAYQYRGRLEIRQVIQKGDKGANGESATPCWVKCEARGSRPVN